MRNFFLGIAAARLVVLTVTLPAVVNRITDTLLCVHTRYDTFFDDLKKAMITGDKVAVTA